MQNVILMMVVNGFLNASLSALFGAIWVTGRILYGIGYAIWGPKGRHIGFAIS